MASAYHPYELRIRVISALETKMTVAKIIGIFKVCRETVYKWKRMRDSTGDIKAKCGYQNGYSRKIIKDKAEFLKFMKINEGKSIKEIVELMPNRASSSTIKRALKSFNYTYKKTFYHPKRDIVAREKFWEEITQIPPEKLVYLDESGIEDNACPLYGWSLRGARCYGNKIDLLHNLKIIEEFLGETKSSTAAYIDVREEQRGVSTTKLPIRLGYARGLFFQSLKFLNLSQDEFGDPFLGE
ncbi:palindromic element RPE1 domain-containing protein [Candidatus Tisiphia endosymbiont of Beris chalybata]|uniref:palindromic element RPE1 domain-containing protein n=1 Tax=Candidatus Tisiphia endosymbiont of Beris chalybata TaxID=3066262 RepID=UPI00312CB640